MAAPFLIVGIGASAGGVEALEQFFRAMPPDNGMAFVVLMHLAPQHDSALAEIIARRTGMAVATARDSELVEPHHVYVLPPGAVMTIEAGRLRLRGRGDGLRDHAPIDIFFGSLAEDQGESAVGIVLSGAGSDGTLGIRAIKERGGLTIAQGSDGTEPRFKDMPESAMASGLVDLVMPVDKMGERLAAFARGSTVERERFAAATKAVHGLLRGRFGHDFSEYKEETFNRRVLRRMQILELTGIEAFLQRLEQDPDELQLLFRDLMIGVTGFFRDPAAFQTLETAAIPKIFEGKGVDQEVRVWVPACTTGEEAYSIAILLHEHSAKLASPPKLHIFATDIDERALTVARGGQYPASALRAVSPERLKRFFTHEGEIYRVKKEVREGCVFSAHSVIRDPPFSRLDLISCRNMLIYMKAELQGRIIPLFHYALRPGGFLFLGQSEGVSRHGDLFQPVGKPYRIFKRTDRATPLSRSVLSFSPQGRVSPLPARHGHETGLPGGNILQAAADTVRDRFGPAYVVVSEAGEILHYSRRTGKFLEPASGAPTSDLFAMTRKELRFELRAALQKAVETRQTVTSDRLAVELDGTGTQAVSLTVQPITKGSDTAFVIVFAELGPVRPPGEPTGDMPSPPGGGEVVQQLERELTETKQRLQAMIEELETSNEELQSSNEEMIAVNEELQSANEELEASREESQSVNEELQTVNAELHRNIAHLEQSSSDLRNVFESTQIGTIFLDRNLTIRTFTPAVTKIYSLVPSDRGRPLADLVNKLDGDGIYPEIRRVLEEGKSIARRVSANGGAGHYLMQILPYRSADRAIDGVLLTFTDIGEIVAGEERLKSLSAELSHRVKNTLAVVVAIAQRTGRQSDTLEAFLKTFTNRLHGLAATHDLLSRTDWADAPLSELIELELAPYAQVGSGRLDVEGPPVRLMARAAVALGMAMNELATNSVKYGALSTATGRVQISWMQPSGTQRLELRWLERDGPKVRSPVKRGFGIEFIERLVLTDLGGEARFEFEKTGLSCTISVPAGAISQHSPAGL